MRTFVLALVDDPGRQVRDPDGAVGLVHVLAARPLCPVRVDLEVALVDLHVGVLGQERGDDHRREGGVAPVSLVERRLAHQPVLAALRLQDAVRVLAADAEGGGLEAGLLPRAHFEQLDLEPAVRGPPLVHPEHHLRPVLGVGAARARLERHDRVTGVVLAVEERVLLELRELLPQRSEQRGDLALHLAAVHRGELARVVVLLPQPPVAVEPPRDPRMLRGDLRRPVLVVPESRRVHLLLELG